MNIRDTVKFGVLLASCIILGACAAGLDEDASGDVSGGGGGSGGSTTVTSPTAMTATVVGAAEGEAIFTWTNGSDATSNNLYYGTSTGVTTANGTKVASVTSGTTLTSLTNGTTYYAITTAVNSSGTESSASSEVNIAPQRNPSAAALKSTFGSSGVIQKTNVAGLAGSHDLFDGVAVGSDGKVYVTGTSLNGAGDYDLVAMKLSSLGVEDSSFSTDGILTDPGVGNGDDGGFGIVPTSDGGAYICGYSTRTGQGANMAVWKFSSTGALDSSFSTDGFLDHNGCAGGSGDDFGYSCLLHSNGSLVVVGKSNNAGGNADLCLWVVSSTGTVSATVTSAGPDADGGDDSLSSVVENSSGCLLAAGHETNAAGNRDGLIAKYCDSSGGSSFSLDTSFSSDGYVTLDFDGDRDVFLGVGLDSSSRILTTGYVLNDEGHASNRDMVVCRWSTTGEADSTFGTSGCLRHNSAAGGGGDDEGLSLIVDDRQNIVVSGYSWPANSMNDMCLWRVTSSGALDTSNFGSGSGFVCRNSDAASGANSLDDGNAIAIGTDGTYIVVGDSTTVALDYDAFCWAY